MLRGYRLLIAATCGLVLFVALGAGAYFGSLYAPQKNYYQTVGADSGQGEPRQRPKNGLADVSGIDGLTERAIAQARPANKQEEDHRDLAAQESMAVFAFWMVCAVSLQTLLAGGALWALLLDLRQNRTSAEQQLRAYLQFDQWLQDEGAFNLQGTPTVGFTIANKGQTPAQNVRGRIAWGLYPPDISQETLDADMKDKGHLLSIGTVTPLVVKTRGTGQLSPEQISAFNSGTLKFVLAGVFEYDDVFGRHWETHYRAETIHPGVPKLMSSLGGNWMT